jgi:hypothetical protein
MRIVLPAILFTLRMCISSVPAPSHALYMYIGSSLAPLHVLRMSTGSDTVIAHARYQLGTPKVSLLDFLLSSIVSFLLGNYIKFKNLR